MLGEQARCDHSDDHTAQKRHDDEKRSSDNLHIHAFRKWDLEGHYGGFCFRTGLTKLIWGKN